MRLLQRQPNNTVALISVDDNDPPPYAILSHTWSKIADEEVKYEDIERGDTSYKNKPGYQKIEFCLAQAEKHGLKHAWVDTCCIDKRSSAELNKTINAMFRYYQSATLCFAYLADVTKHKRKADPIDTSPQWHSMFRFSRWFTRGWTLQELIAPKSIDFFSRDEEYLGTRHELSGIIAGITTIPADVLRGSIPFDEYAIQTRYNWASNRTTTEPEDRIYSLFGILGVSFPPNYGGGYRQALRRLREELIEAYRDQVLTLDFNQGDTGQDRIRNIVSLKRLDDAQKTIRTDHKHALIGSLTFEQKDLRRSNIKPETAKTCQWLIAHPVYESWKNKLESPEHHGLLWIKGKPGAGKSTLMRYIDVHNMRTKSASDLVISFYFNARGTPLEHAVEGMYRSLLCQLIESIDPAELAKLDNALKLYASPRHDATWALNNLEMLFKTLVASLTDQQLTIFIDALDESREEDVRRMFNFLIELCELAIEHNRHLLVCLASRHYPNISLSTGLRLILDDEQGHAEDLEKYVSKTLRIKQRPLADAIRAKVLLKAKGIFIWAVLVIEMLNVDFDRGCIPGMEQRLDEIPQDISELFRRTIRRDDVRMDEFILCLQWTLFSRCPLSCEEFYAVMMFNQHYGKGADTIISKTESSREDMIRYVSSTSKGLAEVVNRGHGMVQFIHETVRDFLLKDGGMQELLEQVGDFQSVSHEQLMLICESAAQSRYTVLGSPGGASKGRQKRFPFLEYATNNIIHHAERAAKHLDQKSFILCFDYQLWQKLDQILIGNRGLETGQALHLLARQNAARLVEIAVRAGCDPNVIEARLGHTPLLTAVWYNACDAARVLLTCRATVKNQDRLGNNALILAADCSGRSHLMRLLIDAGIDISARNKDGKTALALACEYSDEDAVKLLLDGGADILKSCDVPNTLLEWAASGGNAALMTLLTAHMDVNQRDSHGLTALHLVCMQRGSRDGSVELLVECGADVNALDNHGNTALMVALRYNAGTAVIQILLDRGSDVSHVNSVGETALSVANRAWDHSLGYRPKEAQRVIELLKRHSNEAEARA